MDPYKVLGLTRSATIEEIKKAYKKLALMWHPDKNTTNVEEANRRFVDIEKAYKILSDQAERQHKDVPPCAPTTSSTTSAPCGTSQRPARRYSTWHEAPREDERVTTTYVGGKKRTSLIYRKDNIQVEEVSFDDVVREVYYTTVMDADKADSELNEKNT